MLPEEASVLLAADGASRISAWSGGTARHAVRRRVESAHRPAEEHRKREGAQTLSGSRKSQRLGHRDAHTQDVHAAPKGLARGSCPYKYVVPIGQALQPHRPRGVHIELSDRRPVLAQNVNGRARGEPYQEARRRDRRPLGQRGQLNPCFLARGRCRRPWRIFSRRRRRVGDSRCRDNN